jgi:hypothetical protein
VALTTPPPNAEVMIRSFISSPPAPLKVYCGTALLLTASYNNNNNVCNVGRYLEKLKVGNPYDTYKPDLFRKSSRET